MDLRSWTRGSESTPHPQVSVAFHITDPLFSAKIWARGRGKSWEFWLLSFLKSSGSMWLTSFGSVTPDFYSYCSAFSYFFLGGPKKLMRKHSCEMKPVKSAVLKQYRKANKKKKSLIIFTFDYFNSISSPFQNLRKHFLKLGVGHIGELKLWVVSKSLEHISKWRVFSFCTHWIPFKCYCHVLFAKMQKQGWQLWE